MTSRKPKPKDGKTAMDALVAEVDRLREENSILKERAGTIEAQGVAGRLPISDLRDRDWPELIKAVERIPFIYQSTGHLGALAYCQQTVASSLHALSLKAPRTADRSEEHTSELQSLTDISYAVFCLDRKSVV